MTMRNRVANCASLRFLLLAAMLFLLACEPQSIPGTQVLVSINSDLEVGVQLTRLEMALFDAAGDNEVEQHSFQLATVAPAEGQVTLPFSFGVVKGEQERFLLVITGYGPVGAQGTEQVVIEQKTIASFQQGQSRVVRVFLGSVCFENACEGNQRTCYLESTAEVEAGGCGAVPDAKLESFVPGVENDWSFDAGQRDLDASNPTHMAPDAESDAGDDPISAGDTCSPNPCQNDGTCLLTDKVASCGCAAGYVGPRCEVDACEPSPCQHAGVCSRTRGGAGYECDCGSTGWGGTDCQDDIDECASATNCSEIYPCTQTVAPGYTCLGQFADWRMPDTTPGAKYSPNYDLGTSGIVIDGVTGLVWQRASPTTYADCGGVNACTWVQAKSACTNLTLAGQSDWRLPTKIELESIVEPSGLGAAHAVAFMDTQQAIYWTSSPFVGNDMVWGVDFASSGGARMVDRATTAQVRCVRTASIKSLTQRYIVNEAANTVMNVPTNLEWEYQIPSEMTNDAEAEAHCAGLGSGWRIPTIKELATLISPTAAAPAVDPIFVNTPVGLYRSSTADRSTPGWIFQISFGGGSFSSGSAADKRYLRCVR